ncbi:MAG: beta-N-acetylhexosaminidase, partial [Armatimonadota bacterium]
AISQLRRELETVLSSSSLYLLPQPKSITIGGDGIQINDSASIVLEAGSSIGDLLSAQRLKQGLLDFTGFDVPICKRDVADGCDEIVLRVSQNTGGLEAYRLCTTLKNIVIDGASSSGLRYGVETLLQIVKQVGIDLPIIDIDDCPDFAVRGLYHDVTRGQVPTLDTLKRIADLCVSYKINHLELYIEHSFGFRSMTEIGAGMDSLKSDEILELDRYCRERYIDLVPSISTFGHMYEVLRTRSFRHLNELNIDAGLVPYSWKDRMQHYTLDVSNPESINLIERMFDEFLPLFNSDYVNICCDETFDLGKGKNQGIAPSELYIKHLLSVIELVKKRGKRVLFWGDMVLEYSALIDKLPEDAIVLNWDYSNKPSKDATTRFSEMGVAQYVCPGVNACGSFTSKIVSAESNIRTMALYGKDFGVAGLLNTNWGDHGHMNLLAVSLHGIVMGAAYGWNADGAPMERVYDVAFSILACGDRTGNTGELLRLLGEADPNRFWIVGDMSFDELRDAAAKDPYQDADSIRRNSGTALGIKRKLEHLRLAAHPDDRLNYDEFIWAASMIQAVNNYALFVLGEDVNDLPALASQFERLYDRYSLLWRRRNKESELFRIREALLKAARNIRNATMG